MISGIIDKNRAFFAHGFKIRQNFRYKVKISAFRAGNSMLMYAFGRKNSVPGGLGILHLFFGQPEANTEVFLLGDFL